MNIEDIIKELEQIEKKWNGNAASEKLGGNVVKESLYKGTATGVRIAIEMLNERKSVNEQPISVSNLQIKLGRLEIALDTYRKIWDSLPEALRDQTIRNMAHWSPVNFKVFTSDVKVREAEIRTKEEA